jgi:protein-disulfide isomerase
MRTRLLGVLALFVTSVVTPNVAKAAAAPASAPPPAVRPQVVAEVLASYHPYACCADSLATCLKKIPPCPLAKRLELAIGRMAGAGLDKPAIEAALAQRQATMNLEQKRANIVLDNRFHAGDANAPVSLVVYACPRQEACAKLVPDLYREVTDGRLKNKAVLYYRPFFPPGNEEALECGRGLYAAAYQGKFWPYLLHLCLERASLQGPTLRDWVGRHGLDRCIFDHTCEQPDTAAWLEASRKEGLANGVTAAPAAFLDGRRVQGMLDLETLVDLAEEEHERLAQTPAKESATGKPPVRKPAPKVGR